MTALCGYNRKMTENKYQRGKIYKIISNQTEDVYFGSTIDRKLSNRLSDHRVDYKKWLNKEHYYVTSYEIVKFDDAKIILVENFPCTTKYELLAREQWYIENYPCVNKCKAFTGLSRNDYIKKYIEYHKDELMLKRKQYYIQNKNTIAEKQLTYNTRNADKIAEKRKEYYINHKEEILDKVKKYREKRSEKISCICGVMVSEINMKRHLKTKNHQSYISNQPTD